MQRIINLVLIMIISACGGEGLTNATPTDMFSSTETAGLISAVMQKKYVVADGLLKQGANVNDVGKEGLTPLLWVMVKSNFDLDRTQYLLNKGADPNYQEPKGRSAISISVDNGHVELTKLLIKHDGNINQVSIYGGEKSLLCIAALNGDMAMVKTLVEAGASLNWQENKYKSSAADKAASQGQFEIVYYLLKSGLSIELEELKRRVVNRAVPPGDASQKWKDNVLMLLEEKGVK